MMPYSQKDPRWAKQRLGTCNGETLAKSGCKVACYAMIDGRTPAEIDNLLTDNKIYVNGCLTNDKTCASFLGLVYQGRVDEDPVYFGPCIAETNHYRSKGVPQHFFIYRPGDKMILDPLDINPKWKKNPYNIVSYRLIKNSQTQEPMNNVAKIMTKGFGKDYGSNFDEKDAKNAVEKYDDKKKQIETLKKEKEEIVKNFEKREVYIETVNKANDELGNKIKGLEGVIRKQNIEIERCKENNGIKEKNHTIAEALSVLVEAIKKAWK